MKSDETYRMVVVTFLLFVFGCDHRENKEHMVTERQRQTELLQILGVKPYGLHWRINDMGLIDMIALSGNTVNHENIRVVSTIESLRVLLLTCCAYNDEPPSIDDFQQLKSLKNLKCLELYGALEEVSEEMCQAISELSQLEELTISYSLIDINGRWVLEKMHLLHLDIDRCNYPEP